MVHKLVMTLEGLVASGWADEGLVRGVLAPTAPSAVFPLSFRSGPLLQG